MALLLTAALGISALGMFDPYNCSAFCKGVRARNVHKYLDCPHFSNCCAELSAVRTA